MEKCYHLNAYYKRAHQYYFMKTGFSGINAVSSYLEYLEVRNKKSTSSFIRAHCNIDLDYYTLLWMTLYGATKANRAKATGGHVHYNA